MNITKDNYTQFAWFILMLIAISAGLAYLIFEVATVFGELPFWIEIPSVSAIFSLIFLIFNRWLWRLPLFKWAGIIIADDLNGTWEGKVKSSYDDFKSDIYAKLVIEQSATNIKIFGQFNESKSVSIHENFGKSDIDNQMALFFFFRNQPRYDAKKTMAMHEGSAILTYDKAKDTLTGNYYSGRDRNNFGTIEVKRIKI